MLRTPFEALNLKYFGGRIGIVAVMFFTFLTIVPLRRATWLTRRQTGVAGIALGRTDFINIQTFLAVLILYYINNEVVGTFLNTVHLYLLKRLLLLQFQIGMLFMHEALRVFHDRLINAEDKNYFYNMLSDIAAKYFSLNVIKLYISRSVCIIALASKFSYLSLYC